MACSATARRVEAAPLPHPQLFACGSMTPLYEIL